MATKKFSTYLRSHFKLVAMVVGLVIFTGAVILYAVWSLNSWSSYDAAYRQWDSSVRARAAKVLDLPSEGQVAIQKKTDSLKSFITEMDRERDSICDVHAMIRWQTSINSFNSKKKMCFDMANRAKEMSIDLQKATAYLEDEKRGLDILAKLELSGDEMKEDSWTSIAQAWREAAEKFNKAKFSTEFKPVAVTSTEKIQLVATSWQGILDANLSKNKANFLSAQAKLNDAYAQLPQISKASAAQYAAVLSSLESIKNL